MNPLIGILLFLLFVAAEVLWCLQENYFVTLIGFLFYNCFDLPQNAPSYPKVNPFEDLCLI